MCAFDSDGSTSSATSRSSRSIGRLSRSLVNACSSLKVVASIARMTIDEVETGCLTSSFIGHPSYGAVLGALVSNAETMPGLRRTGPDMFIRFTATLLLLLAPVARAANRTWITDVTIISPEKLDRVEKGSVLIEDGRIVRVDRGMRAKKPAGAAVVSGKGEYLIPGLIDSHVHLAAVPGASFDVA